MGAFNPHHPEFVYLLFGVLRGEPTLKIGRTWNLKLRTRQHELNKKCRLSLVGYIPVKNFYESVRLESSLNKRFQNKPRQEWHFFNPKIISHFFSQDGAIICGGYHEVV